MDENDRLASCILTALGIGERSNARDHVCFVKENVYRRDPESWTVPHSELAIETRHAGQPILVACINRADKGRSGYVFTKQNIHADVTGERIKMCGYLDGLINEVMPPSLSNDLKGFLNMK